MEVDVDEDNQISWQEFQTLMIKACAAKMNVLRWSPSESIPEDVVGFISGAHGAVVIKSLGRLFKERLPPWAASLKEGISHRKRDKEQAERGKDDAEQTKHEIQPPQPAANTPGSGVATDGLAPTGATASQIEVGSHVLIDDSVGKKFQNQEAGALFFSRHPN